MGCFPGIPPLHGWALPGILGTKQKGHKMFDENGLSTVTVNKNQLLVALRKNLETHRSTFEEALKGYREAVIVELEKSLNNARKNLEIRRTITLEEPRDHSSDYRRIIKMLEMSVDEEVEITEQQFNQYVLDEWTWKHQFDTVSAIYNNKF